MLNPARFAEKKCGAPFAVYRTFFIFVRKVIYLKKITADFAVSITLLPKNRIMESNINISSCKYEEFTGLKLQGSNWELNLRLSKEDIQTLHKGIKEADWAERKSIKAGATCLSVPIYWNYEEKNNIVCIILGEDDECWDVGFVISFSDFERMITTLIE